MSKSDVERLLGPPDYSPIAGEYYYYSGDGCHIDVGDDNEAPRMMAVPCGIVVDYRRWEPGHLNSTLSTSLQTCRWGAIGE